MHIAGDFISCPEGWPHMVPRRLVLFSLNTSCLTPSCRACVRLLESYLLNSSELPPVADAVFCDIVPRGHVRYLLLEVEDLHEESRMPAS